MPSLLHTLQQSALRNRPSSGPLVMVTAGGAILGRHALRSPMVLGRDPRSDIPIADPSISARHLEFFSVPLPGNGREWWARDLASRNGTLWRGRPMLGALRLGDQDWLALGQNCLLFFLEPQPAMMTYTRRNTGAEAGLPGAPAQPSGSLGY